MNKFKLINEEELNEIKQTEIEIQNNKDMEIDYKLCIECNISMNSNINNSYTCPKCGYIKYISTDNNEYEESFKHYNVSETYHMPLKYVGKDSYKLQQNLRNSTSSYNPIQESSIKKYLNNCNSESNDFIIPYNIIQQVCEIYKKIRIHSKVFRGEILKGVLCSLIYYISLKEGITRKPKEISKWGGIAESDLSAGDKHIRILQEEGVLDIIVNKNLDDDYILSYLKRLNIDIKYNDFLQQLLILINKKKVGNTNARTSTKVTSIVYLLCVAENIQLNQLLKINNTTEQIISDEFSISVSTFKLFYNTILKNKEKLNPLFEEYKIIFPSKTSNRKNKKKT